MGTKGRFQSFSNPALVFHQLRGMATKYPWFAAKRQRNHIEWVGAVQPTENSPAYTISVKYFFNWGWRHRNRNHRIEVRVLSPRLELHAGKNRLPHVYSHNRLCLFYPRYGEWTPNRLISETILDWTVFWLAHYEIWVVTGVWTADEIHRPRRKKRTSRF